MHFAVGLSNKVLNRRGFDSIASLVSFFAEGDSPA
jgi:hypothetical protein